jgi:two-component system chemotaxis response regulator CheY
MRVLVVDDSVTAARQLGDIIAQISGCEVVEIARNGAEAIKLYQQLSPDVVCMDIVMPVMDGLQAMRVILQRDKTAKVVIVSSIGGVADKAVEALKFGAKSIISKPFQPEEIRKTLQALRDVAGTEAATT